MAMGVNKVILVGRVGQNPEIRYMPGGDATVKLSLAVSRSWKNKSGEKTEATEWVNLVAFRGLAEIIDKYVSKGDPLYVEGRLQTRSWDDKNSGEKKYITEVVLTEMQMLGSRGGGGERQGAEQSGGGRRYSNEPDGGAPPLRDPEPEFDDDIPF